MPEFFAEAAELSNFQLGFNFQGDPMYSTSLPYSTASLASLLTPVINPTPVSDEVIAHALPPLTVNIEQQSVRINRTGKWYPLPSVEVARWLNVLAQRPGEWLSSADFAAFDPTLVGRRVERMRRKLPLNIVGLIECKRGQGARLQP